MDSPVLKRRVEDQSTESSDDSSEPSEEQAGPSAETPAVAGSAADQRRPSKQTKRLYDKEAAEAQLRYQDQETLAKGQANAKALLQGALAAQKDVRALVFGFDSGGTQIGTGARSIVLIPSCDAVTEVFELSQCHLVRNLQQSGWVGRVEELLRGTPYWRNKRVSDPSPHTSHRHASTPAVALRSTA